MDEEQLFNTALLGRKDGKLTSIYNFDLSELMANFDFFDFCDEAKGRGSMYQPEHGAVLVITNSQYILSYNSSFGVGTHMATLARIYADIHNYGFISDNIVASHLSSECESKYICARIFYENNAGYISFNLAPSGYSNDLTPEMFDVFSKFYHDYNEDIQEVCKKFKIEVLYKWQDNKGKTIRETSSNLDNLYQFLKSKIDIDAQYNDEEIIIGITPNKNKIKKR